MDHDGVLPNLLLLSCRIFAVVHAFAKPHCNKACGTARFQIMLIVRRQIKYKARGNS